MRKGISFVEFLSTPSARRATGEALQETKVQDISIHALREEGDPAIFRAGYSARDFYPRPPRGGRHFALTPINSDVTISIHALREEGDRWKH